VSERNAVYRGIVVEGRDPKGHGRVQVSLPDFDERVWAPRATLDAGDGRGTWFVPAAGDEVLVAFEHGDVRRPFVLGALWNGEDTPGDLVQTDGSFRLRSAETVGAKADKKMELEAVDELTVKVGDASVVLKKDGSITIKSSAAMTLDAGSSMTIKATGSLSVQANGTVSVKGAQVQLG